LKRIRLRSGTVTSAANFGFNMAALQSIKLKWEQKQSLRDERSALLAELQAHLSSAALDRVESAMRRRGHELRGRRNGMVGTLEDSAAVAAGADRSNALAQVLLNSFCEAWLRN
jgi:hypothetical protein